MPSREALDLRAPSVRAFSTILSGLLARAAEAKPTSSIEPALTKADFGDLTSQLSTFFAQYPSPETNGTDASEQSNKSRQFSIMESAARDLCNRLISTTHIDSPDFVKVWNLLDLLTILSDDGEFDYIHLLWIIEELVDSQTIAGCRKIFDFLESRRERIINKNFKHSAQLVVLRTCNELLRRLSRAEDTAFCGRVFIFMFQSFPLGDKSSVNLRGEYHLENVTTFDETTPPKTAEDGADKMDIDQGTNNGASGAVSKTTSKVTSDAAKQAQADKPLEPDALYPLFWSLQECFSQPKKLFEKDEFARFKKGLEATITSFRAIQSEQGSRPSKATDDTKQALKPNLGNQDNDDITNTFNPKYLTSRDLFELEISDISFRRYVFIQALVIIDFLLSLSPKAKEKLASVKVPNKSVAYADQVLSEEDTTWATAMREKITTQLKLGYEGAHFHRMVEMVISRDKNWIRWKIEGCPPISKDQVTPEEFADAKKSIMKATTPRPPPSFAVGSLDLSFLDTPDEDALFEALKSQDRYQLPDLDSYQAKLADDDFEIGMAKDAKTKAEAVEKKASDSWRALRISSRSKLAAFDRIDDPDKIDIIFEDNPDLDDADGSTKPEVASEDLPEDTRPIVISGPAGAETAAFTCLLIERHRGVFAKVARHTSRARKESEVEGKDYHFVDSATFNMMLDGDQFVEFRDDEGTNRKSIEAISENGMIPLLVFDSESLRQARDMGFSARQLLLKPPSVDAIVERLKAAGESEETAAETAMAAEAEMADIEWEQSFDAVISDNDMEAALVRGENHIFGKDETDAVDGRDGEKETIDEDQAMVDAPEGEA